MSADVILDLNRRVPKYCMNVMKIEELQKRASRLRFNFGFLLESSPGTTREIAIDYPTITLEDEIILSPLSGVFDAIRSSKGIYITGQLHTNFAGNCVRCLGDLLVPITLELDDLFYYPAHLTPAGEYGVGDDGFIDLTPLVRELNLLGIPTQPYCKDECQGLCAECGVNLNIESCSCIEEHIDPRFSKLQALLKTEEKSNG